MLLGIHNSDNNTIIISIILSIALDLKHSFKNSDTLYLNLF